VCGGIFAPQHYWHHQAIAWHVDKLKINNLIGFIYVLLEDKCGSIRIN
jgi:hypothetical protein